ncbi:phage shock protein C (PspC) family protein [Glycomyces sambucus]|uniref:Phage shock protein C (PspC) family protein n=1 Tax=Glycomyces sambucus TaxID=380244 RepID=A0A1G9DEX4_9ACTN|nr:PspC domain-containing protein [Glycomyces sambucus]SDK62426.1 phage shock protein C (PspC) family protein [Glycomyces sambucus]
MDHIALSGHSGAFPVTAPAKRLLVSYLADARSAVGSGPDGDETVRDIEMAIGDRLRAELDGGPAGVEEAAMARILAETGPVEPGPDSASATGAAPSGPAASAPRAPGRSLPWLYRIDEGKWFGGLCLGLATRSDLRVDWVRVFAIVFLFVTSGLLGVAYLIALLFVPRMETVEEYRAALEESRRGHRP